MRQPYLLEKILRQEWGFEGYVVSDCWAIQDIYKYHKVVQTAEQAAALAVAAGCDLNCGSTYPALRGAVEQGLISEAEIDQAVTRLFTARFKLGMFDPPERVPYAQIPFSLQRFRRAPGTGFAGGARVDRAAQERGPTPSAAQGSDGHRSDWTECRRGAGPAGQLQRHAIPRGNAAERRPPRGRRWARLYYARGCALADGVPNIEPIPTACLRPAAVEAGATGLTGAYFAADGLGRLRYKPGGAL